MKNRSRRAGKMEKALDLACKRLMSLCLDDKCPVIHKECMTGVPTRKDCAARMKAYLLRRVR